MSALAWIAVAGTFIVVLYVAWAWMLWSAPLYDADERPVDEVQDDPRPAQVLRQYQDYIHSGESHG
jgi:hypothetical protein